MEEDDRNHDRNHDTESDSEESNDSHLMPFSGIRSRRVNRRYTPYDRRRRTQTEPRNNETTDQSVSPGSSVRINPEHISHSHHPFFHDNNISSSNSTVSNLTQNNEISDYIEEASDFSSVSDQQNQNDDSYEEEAPDLPSASNQQHQNDSSNDFLEQNGDDSLNQVFSIEEISDLSSASSLQNQIEGSDEISEQNADDPSNQEVPDLPNASNQELHNDGINEQNAGDPLAQVFQIFDRRNGNGSIYRWNRVLEFHTRNLNMSMEQIVLSLTRNIVANPGNVDAAFCLTFNITPTTQQIETDFSAAGDFNYPGNNINNDDNNDDAVVEEEVEEDGEGENEQNHDDENANDNESNNDDDTDDNDEYEDEDVNIGDEDGDEQNLDDENTNDDESVGDD